MTWRIRSATTGYEVVRRLPQTAVWRVLYCETAAEASRLVKELNDNLTEEARRINRDFEAAAV